MLLPVWALFTLTAGFGVLGLMTACKRGAALLQNWRGCEEIPVVVVQLPGIGLPAARSNKREIEKETTPLKMQLAYIGRCASGFTAESRW
jgi:hypothetical protein